MRIVGFIFLVTYLLDSLVTFVSVLYPSIQRISDTLSVATLIMTMLVLLIAALGCIEPKRLYLALSCFYISVIGFGMVLGAALTMRLGPDTELRINDQVLQQYFPRYRAVSLILALVSCLLATYGLVLATRSYRRGTS